MTACTTVPQASLKNRTLLYGCNDTVVVGRVESGVFESVVSRDDILADGWVTATLKVQKVVKGRRLPPVLQVRYFAHTYMRDDVDFMLVLKRTDGGAYEIATGQLMSLRPLLSNRCE